MTKIKVTFFELEAIIMKAMPIELGWFRIDPTVDDKGDSCRVLYKKCQKQIKFRHKWDKENRHNYEVVYSGGGTVYKR